MLNAKTIILTTSNEKNVGRDQQENQEISRLRITKVDRHDGRQLRQGTLRTATCGVSLQINGRRGDDSSS